ncbi:sensor histidine kinase [Gaopeijia maritima]|uniref:histidine kinase n=1 Tax=Gaopeijia maritima TaxID=3119007 RepID=A0ABU9E8P3_9BACT
MTNSTLPEGLGRSRRWVRWGLLLTPLTFAVALLASAWGGYRSAKGAMEALQRGQAEMLAGSFRGGLIGTWERGQVQGSDRFRPLPPDRAPLLGDSADAVPGPAEGPVRRPIPSDREVMAVLDSVVADRAEAGLRWAGFLSPDDEVLVEGGARLSGPLQVPSRPDRPALVRVGERVRSFFIPPGDDGASRPTLVLEFEPVIARSMVSSAVRSLVLAAVVAGLLTVAGLGLLRLSLRFEAAERRMEERRRLALLGEMSAVLAHEIRNPLASLKGHAQLLVERLADTPNERRRAERVVGEATRLEALTTDLLDFAGSGPLHLEEVDPIETVRVSATEAAPEVVIPMSTQTAPERWPLDTRRLRQALVNLVRNAAQASPDGPPPEITVATEAGRLVIEVRDHGAGLPPGQEDRIFDPFFTTRTTGTGLGLAVTRRIAELHGGELTASNAEGGGARFRLEFPRRS